MFSLRIAEGRTIQIKMSNGDNFTIKRDRGSMFVVDASRTISVKLIPKFIHKKTKKEESNGNR